MSITLHRRRRRSSSTAPTAGPTDDARRVRAGRRPDARRGHAPAPGARRRARPPHVRARRASTRSAAGARSARAGAHLGRAGPASGRAARRRLPSAVPSRWPARAPSTRSDGRRRARRPILVDHGPLAGPVRELRAHAARDRRAVRRRLRARHRAARRAGSRPRSTSTTSDDPPRAVVKAELAGVDLQDVALEIRGPPAAHRRRAARRPRRRAASTSRSRSSTGPFRRVVELGADVDADEARASYEDGILEVEIPLAPADAAAACPDRRAARLE